MINFNEPRNDDRGGNLVLNDTGAIKPGAMPKGGHVVLQTGKRIWIELQSSGAVTILGKKMPPDKTARLVDALRDWLVQAVPTEAVGKGGVAGGINLYPGVGPKGHGDIIFRKGDVDMLTLCPDGIAVTDDGDGERTAHTQDAPKSVLDALSAWLKGIGYAAPATPPV